MIAQKVLGLERALVGEKEQLVCHLAEEIERRIIERANQSRLLVLGLATGNTPIPLYTELVRKHRDEGLSFENVVSFNLDEYEGLSSTHPQSYHRFMKEHLFDHIDILPENTFIPHGSYECPLVEARGYEEKMQRYGGIDFQILGIGRDGHIGFNDPNSSVHSRTRRVSLACETREDAAAVFGGIQNVPTHAMTMGVETILEARSIVLMAWGSGKREIVRAAMSGEVSAETPASFLQDHSNTTWYLDEAAAGD